MRVTNLIFLIFLYSFSFAQRYQSVIENNDSITILASNPGEGLSESIIIKHDTLINGYKYIKIGFEFDFPQYIVNTESDFYSNKLYLREDSTSSKLYIYSEEKDFEQLIMDLNLHPKDTFQIGESEKFIVDSVFYNNGLKIVQFENNRDFGMLNLEKKIKLQFIEGIGPNWSFFYPFNYGGKPSLLLCSYKDNTISYINPNNFDCYEFWRVTNIDKIKESDILRITNELSFTKIEVDSEKLFNLYVFNVTGKQVLMQNDIYRNTKIQLTGHSVFIAQIIIDDKVYTRKIANKNYW